MAEIKWSNVDGSALNGAVSNSQSATNSFVKGLHLLGNDVVDFTDKLQQRADEAAKWERDQATQAYISKIYDAKSREDIDKLVASGTLDAQNALNAGAYSGQIDLAKLNQAKSTMYADAFNRADSYDKMSDYSRESRNAFAQIQAALANRDTNTASALLSKYEGSLSLGTRNKLVEQIENVVRSDREYLLDSTLKNAQADQYKASAEKTRMDTESVSINNQIAAQNHANTMGEKFAKDSAEYNENLKIVNTSPDELGNQYDTKYSKTVVQIANENNLTDEQRKQLIDTYTNGSTQELVSFLGSLGIDATKIDISSRNDIPQKVLDIQKTAAVSAENIQKKMNESAKVLSSLSSPTKVSSSSENSNSNFSSISAQPSSMSVNTNHSEKTMGKIYNKTASTKVTVDSVAAQNNITPSQVNEFFSTPETKQQVSNLVSKGISEDQAKAEVLKASINQDTYKGIFNGVLNTSNSTTNQDFEARQKAINEKQNELTKQSIERKKTIAAAEDEKFEKEQESAYEHESTQNQVSTILTNAESETNPEKRADMIAAAENQATNLNNRADKSDPYNSMVRIVKSGKSYSASIKTEMEALKASNLPSAKTKLAQLEKLNRGLEDISAKTGISIDDLVKEYTESNKSQTNNELARIISKASGNNPVGSTQALTTILPKNKSEITDSGSMKIPTTDSEGNVTYTNVPFSKYLNENTFKNGNTPRGKESAAYKFYEDYMQTKKDSSFYFGDMSEFASAVKDLPPDIANSPAGLYVVNQALSSIYTNKTKDSSNVSDDLDTNANKSIVEGITALHNLNVHSLNRIVADNERLKNNEDYANSNIGRLQYLATKYRKTYGSASGGSRPSFESFIQDESSKGNSTASLYIDLDVMKGKSKKNMNTNEATLVQNSRETLANIAKLDKDLLDRYGKDLNDENGNPLNTGTMILDKTKLKNNPLNRDDRHAVQNALSAVQSQIELLSDKNNLESKNRLQELLMRKRFYENLLR